MTANSSITGSLLTDWRQSGRNPIPGHRGIFSLLICSRLCCHGLSEAESAHLARDIVQRDKQVVRARPADLKISADCSRDRIRTESAEVSEFRLCSFEDGDIRIRMVPKCEEILVLGSSLCRFSRQGKGASQAKVRYRADWRIRNDAAMVDNFLKFCGGLRAFSFG